MSYSNIIETNCNKHAMLLYHSDDMRNKISINSINKGLERGQLCIYASVDAYNNESSFNISNLSSKISNYQENIQNGNLRIINFKPYYESAISGDLTPFRELKSELESTLSQRLTDGKRNEILVIADAACSLSQHKHFGECIVLERWWQDVHDAWIKNNLNITVICPHPGIILNDGLFGKIKNKISHCHTLTIDLEEDHLNKQTSDNFSKKNKSIRVLIAESDTDMGILYTEYFEFIGLEAVIVESGNKCLNYVLQGRDKDFDMIIVDTHLRDISGIEVAKKIRDGIPNQRIVFTTTYLKHEVCNVINQIGIDIEDCITKPFKLSTLLSVIKPNSTIREIC
ncbi:MAG: response regulator [Nitrososphaeraceae archaeon]